ncbi:TNT domain-containing protein [Listeria costaricensis]|uniref:TNT domain-containing protein n=1 Tax=Listeria costaricensis TaxID=2026604 RepID=UPI0013C47483|nr:TNT domain-containing protein [Listeria costaricensis]
MPRSGAKAVSAGKNIARLGDNVISGGKNALKTGTKTVSSKVDDALKMGQELASSRIKNASTSFKEAANSIGDSVKEAGKKVGNLNLTPGREMAVAGGGKIGAGVTVGEVVNDIKKGAQTTGNKLKDFLNDAAHLNISGSGNGSRIDDTLESIDKYEQHIQKIVKQSTCTNDELYTYLSNIDSKLAEEFKRTNNWPVELQVPKSSDVLTIDGKIDWSHVPNNGYVLDDSGNAIKKDYIPKIGDKFDRYGPNDGRFTSPVNDNKPYRYEERSLPYVEDATKYHHYEVVGNFENIKSYVDRCTDAALKDKIYNDVVLYYGNDWQQIKISVGEIASGFGTPGGGTQWQFPFSVEVLEKIGLVKEIF